jgi:hypothetical protein
LSSLLNSFGNSLSLASGRTKINSLDPLLTTVWTSYPSEPLLPFFHPPIELASRRPHGQLHLDRRIDFTAIRFY